MRRPYELRTVNFWNEVANQWEFECFVRIVAEDYISPLLDRFLGTVEYADGTYLDVYNSNGILVGYEYEVEDDGYVLCTCDM